MKFMFSLNGKLAEDLQRMANERQISIQDLIRVVIIPEWKMATGKFTLSDALLKSDVKRELQK